MKTIGNIIWFIFGGVELALCWLIFGLIWCITIVGIPVGVQCFKLAGYTAMPFKKQVEYESGVGKFFLNVIWAIFGGLEIALVCCCFGLIFFVTIIGIPFGKQFFRIAKLALRPFGAKVVKKV